MLRVCGTDATAPHNPTTASDKAAMRAGSAEDKALLRAKVGTLSGRPGCARFDAALADVFMAGPPRW
jgi:hypothetical protein